MGELVEAKSLHDGRDEEFDCWILDEDKVSVFVDIVFLTVVTNRCVMNWKIK